MTSDIPDAKATLEWLAKKCDTGIVISWDCNIRFFILWMGDTSMNHNLALISDEFGHVAQFLSQIVFLDLARLFHKLCKYVSLREKNFTSPIVQFEMDAMAANVLNKPSSYSFRSEISCQYHREVILILTIYLCNRPVLVDKIS